MLVPNDKERPADAPAKAPDPFDPAALRLSQDFGAMVGGEKILTTVPVRKPSKENWFRVHPDEAYRLNTIVCELKEDSETFLLSAELQSLLGTEPTLRVVTLHTCIDRANNVFLWPIPLPGMDGKDNPWHQSAREAVRLASERWVRIVSNRSLGAYEASVTRAELAEPSWPGKTFGELLKIAFRDRFIDSIDHPILKRLRGEA
jgi:hypothetical protein